MSKLHEIVNRGRMLVLIAAVGLFVGLSATQTLADAATDFDTLSEGFLGTEVTVDGIRFYEAKVFPFEKEDAVFVAENAIRYFDENPHLEPFFSRPNVFQLSGYIGGDGWLITRFFKIHFSTGEIESEAALEFFYKASQDEFMNVTVALQGLMRGEVVVEDTFTVTELIRDVRHETLAISGVPFDEMRLICRNATWGILGSIDNLRIANVSPSALYLEAPVPGVAGERNVIRATWPTPGEKVFFGYGMRPGVSKVPGCGGLTIELRNPKVLGSALVDGDGVAEYEFDVPANAAGLYVYFQALQHGACVKSNLVAMEFE